MHVFFITQWFPSSQNPMYGIFILEHARAVAQLHNVSLLHIQGIDQSSIKPVQIISQMLDKRLMVYHLSYRHPLIPRTAWLRQLSGAHQAFQIASQRFGRINLIHANVNNTAVMAVLLGWLANIPTVLSEHSSAYARQLFKPSQIRTLRFFMNRIDVIMPVSIALGQQMRGYGITRPMIPVPNVVDTDLFYPAAPGEQVTDPMREIALIARLSKEKAVHLTLQALALLRQQGIILFLHIAGDGPERENLQSLAKDLGISEYVKFHGYQPKKELAMILRRSSAFVLSSVWETQSVVILEALTCGLPVIAPSIGGIPEIVTSNYGRLFQPGNSEDLARQLFNILTNLVDYDSQAIYRYAADNFSLAAVGSKFDHVYQQVIVDRHAFDN